MNPDLRPSRGIIIAVAVGVVFWTLLALAL
jgi:hypothetical protein